MKTLKTMALSGAMALVSSGSALAAAVDTSKTYSSGLLIGLFLAFCALLVVVQMVPSIMLLVGFIKGLSRRTDNEGEVATGSPKA